MILVRISGGLGNQMFQYAAGCSLARQLNVPLKLDLRAYAEKGSRPFELNKLCADIQIATEGELPPLEQQSVLVRLWEKRRPAYRRNIYKQPGFAYDPNFTKTKDGAYLKGYWQSWKYFAGNEAEIRRSFQIKAKFTHRIQPLVHSLCTGSSISVHIRRGDYQSPEALAYHGLLPASYYNTAITRMRKSFPDARFLLFTDDIPWVQENIRDSTEMTLVTDQYSHTALEDFFLMQHCRHHIIANSSFSWWAAWLNSGQDKKVIAPEKWFATTANETRDICPPDWIRL